MNYTIVNGFLRPVPGSAPILRGTSHTPNSPASRRTHTRPSPVTFRGCTGNSAADHPLCDLADQSWLHQPSRSELLDTIIQREMVIIGLALGWVFVTLMFFLLT